jgi:hypothetical protein
MPNQTTLRRARRRPDHARSTIASVAVLTALAVTLVAGCGRSGSSTQTPSNSATSGSSATSSAAAAKGDFGTLKGVCKPGTPKGGSGRGITATTVRVGTIADPGASVYPGLEQEFFDVADAFVKWCNDAGGINGRKIVLDKWDAKYFNVAASTIDACQHDFMLVGNGNAGDAPGVKPRLGCKLGEVPSYSVSNEAIAAGLQVNPTPNPINQFQIGPFRLLGAKFPETKTKGIAIGGSSFASLQAIGRRAKEAITSVGYRVPLLQERPVAVVNWRPYMEQIKLSGATALSEAVGNLDDTPEISAISTVGLQLDYLLFGTQHYTRKTIAAAKATPFPPTWTYFSHLPFELADQYPVVKQLKGILTSTKPDIDLDEFTSLATNAWLLWMTSATECGDNLTQDCVLKQAGAHKDWTAGGFFSPRDTDPNNPLAPTCYVMMKITPQGFVYDKDVTDPNKGPYNCSPDNVVDVKNTYANLS